MSDTAKPKILVISNGLEPPFDEGIKKFAHQFVIALAGLAEFESLAVSIKPSDPVPLKKFFWNTELRRSVNRFSPDAVFYIPTSSGSFAAFLRQSILRFSSMGKRTRMIMVLLQPNPLQGVWKVLSKMLAPDMIVTQSRSAHEYYEKNRFNVDVVDVGVDLETFQPCTPERKNTLRVKYRVGANDTVYLHVGHINAIRNLEAMAAIRKSTGARVFVVGSTSSPQDVHMLDLLRDAGVDVINDYVEDIASFYQMADCYIFPTHNDNGAIGIPLSVLEAMACNLPVISTRFGRLPALIQEGGGFQYFDHDSELQACLERTKLFSPVATREKVKEFSWSRLVEHTLRKGLGKS